MPREESKPKGMGKSRAIVLALFVVVVTGAAIHFLGEEDSRPAAEAEAADDAVVEVAPVVPTSNIVSASWRSEAQRRKDRAAEAAEEGESTSLLERAKWSEDEDEVKYDKSLEKVVKDIQGLGIFVAPLDEAKKDTRK